MNEQRASFRGGPYAGMVPLGVFLAIAIYLVIRGAPTTEGMILAAMAGLSAGMFFSKNFAAYSERVFSLMANRVAAVAIVCWLWAGVFSGILAESGLVEAIVWLGWKFNVQGAAFVVVTFFSASVFAVAVGTGLGTVLNFTAFMYPAGVLLGADPAVMMGAIISGGAFGDNLAPISDTTIVSAATQETDVPGVVRSRLKYVLVAGGIAAVLFYAYGEGSAAAADDESVSKIVAKVSEQGGPTRLFMLIPPIVVVGVALSGRHFLAALTAGIITAAILGPILNRELVLFTITESGDVSGAMVSGAMGLVPTAILTLLLVTAIGLMSESGTLDAVLNWLEKHVARTARGAEAAIVALISLANLCVSVNTVAMITAGPLANELRKRHGIDAYRSANLLDTISCSFPYILPYSAIIPAAIATQHEVTKNYPNVVVTDWIEMAPYAFYTIVLFIVMLLSVLTGYGRKSG